MQKAMLTILLSFVFQSLISQNDESKEYRIVQHVVQMGETVKMLSQKYLTPPGDIYRLNKFAVDGITKGMVLQIPIPIENTNADNREEKSAVVEESVTTKEVIADNPPQSGALSSDGHVISHLVQSGQTLSGLAEKYGVSISDIKEANPKVAKRGLQADESIIIPAAAGIIPSNGDAAISSENAAVASSTEIIEHVVISGDTLTGLSEKYDVSIAEIQRQNKKLLKRGLQIGQVLKISKP